MDLCVVSAFYVLLCKDENVEHTTDEDEQRLKLDVLQGVKGQKEASIIMLGCPGGFELDELASVQMPSDLPEHLHRT